MRKLELIRALLGLELAHAAIVEDRHRVSVAVFESPVDRQSAIVGGLEHHHRQTVSVFDDFGVGLFEAKECFN